MREIIPGDRVIPEGLNFPVLVSGIDTYSGYLICQWLGSIGDGGRDVFVRIHTYPREKCKLMAEKEDGR